MNMHFSKYPPSFLEVWAILKTGKKTKAWYDPPNKCWWPCKNRLQKEWMMSPIEEEVIGWAEIKTNSLKRQVEAAKEYHKTKNECNKKANLL